MTGTLKTLAASVIAVVMICGTAFAAAESQVIFRKGNWYVEVVYDAESGGSWCAAVTDNGNGQQLDVTLFDQGEMILYVWDNSWQLKERQVDFRLDVDRSRWDMRGTADGQSVSLGLNGRKEAVQLLDDLYAGRSVRVYNDKGSKLATFSLTGSASSLRMLFDCGTKIGAFVKKGSSDPFN